MVKILTEYECRNLRYVHGRWDFCDRCAELIGEYNIGVRSKVEHCAFYRRDILVSIRIITP